MIPLSTRRAICDIIQNFCEIKLRENLKALQPQGGAMDSIADLPEDIIHRILSFMEFDEGMQASLLCKSWLRAYRTRPSLDLDGSFLINKISSKYIYYETMTQKLHSFAKWFNNYIDETLLRYQEQKIRIHTLKLFYFGNDYSWESWIETAVANGVKVVQLRHNKHTPLIARVFPKLLESESLEELDLCYGSSSSDCMEQVPQKIMCSNLKKLNLQGVSIDEVDLQRIISSCKMIELLALSKVQVCGYMKPQFLGNNICVHLKRLSLSMVRLDEVKFQRIISSCKMVEFLSIAECEGIQTCKVTGLLSLKELSISTSKEQLTPRRVEVDAPTLEALSITNSFSCVELNLNPPECLKSLKLHCVGINDEFFLDLASKFPCLEELEIKGCLELQRIKISSRSLRKFEMEYTTYQFKDLQVDAPNLAMFKLRVFRHPSEWWG